MAFLRQLRFFILLTHFVITSFYYCVVLFSFLIFHALKTSFFLRPSYFFFTYCVFFSINRRIGIEMQRTWRWTTSMISSKARFLPKILQEFKIFNKSSIWLTIWLLTAFPYCVFFLKWLCKYSLLTSSMRMKRFTRKSTWKLTIISFLHKDYVRMQVYMWKLSRTEYSKTLQHKDKKL